MTIGLRIHVEPTSVVSKATANNRGNTCYYLLLDNGNVYEHETTLYPINTVTMVTC